MKTTTNENIQKILEKSRRVIEAYYITNRDVLEDNDVNDLQTLMSEIDELIVE